MKGTLVRALMALCCFIASGTALAAETDTALAALRQLNAKSEVGIGYKEYAALVESTNAQVKTCLNSREAGTNAALRRDISKAMQHHQNASRVWSVHIAFPSSDFVFENRPDWHAFLEYYPEGVKLMDGSGGKPGKRSVSFQDMLSYMWNKAQKETAEAEKLYRSGPPSKKSKK